METPKTHTNINDHFDAFMWAYAIWYWLSHHHEGQASDKYAAMSMSTIYNMTNIPSIDFDSQEHDDENEMAIEYYHQINEDNWNDIYNEFCNYMDNDWDNDDVA